MGFMFVVRNEANLNFGPFFQMLIFFVLLGTIADADVV